MFKAAVDPDEGSARLREDPNHAYVDMEALRDDVAFIGLFFNNHEKQSYRRVTMNT